MLLDSNLLVTPDIWSRKVVTHLPLEGRKVEGSWKYRRWERAPEAGSRREETVTEPRAETLQKRSSTFQRCILHTFADLDNFQKFPADFYPRNLVTQMTSENEMQKQNLLIMVILVMKNQSYAREIFLTMLRASS